MEYIEGRTLDNVLAAEGPLPMEQARTLLAQIASALTAAHQKGVIHRDVRPGNILLEHDTGRAVLSDFGLSGIKETGSEVVTRLTQVGEALGDPRYSSPEQLLGDMATDATDVYSFGVVGYEVIGGCGPYDAATVREEMAAKLQRPPRLLREMRPDVPAAIERLLDRCLSRNPEHRPRAAELRQLLDYPDARASADAVNEREPPFIPALSSFLSELRRRRVYRAAAAYLAVAFVALQGADIVLPALPLPAWTLTALVVLTLTGFPVVLVLTWIYDLNRGGLERTPDAAPEPQLPGDRIARRTLQVAGISLSLIVAALLAWWVFD
jgi:serine/threonine protein kinase